MARSVRPSTDIANNTTIQVATTAETSTTIPPTTLAPTTTTTTLPPVPVMDLDDQLTWYAPNMGSIDFSRVVLDTGALAAVT